MLQFRKRAAAAVVLGMTAATVLAACGDDSSNDSDDKASAADFSELMTMSNDDLYAEAKDEGGALLFYSAQASEKTDAVVQAFQEAYPDISVQVYRAGSDTILPRIIQEQDAGRAGNDVVDFGAYEQGELVANDLVEPYTGSGTEGLAEGAAESPWPWVRFLIYAPSWNTDAVSEADAPQSWEDTADDEWDGRMAVETSDVPFFWNLTQYWEANGKSEDEAMGLLGDIFDGADKTDGHTTTAQLMAAGEFDMTFVNYTSTVETQIQDGAPLAYTPAPDPVFAEPSGISIMKTAPHPATAVLFTNWILTDGQQVVAEEAFDVPTREEYQPDWIKGLNVIPFDPEGYAEVASDWEATMQELLTN